MRAERGESRGADGDGRGRGLRGIRAPQDVRLPPFVRVAQRWPSPGRVDIEAEVHRQLGAPESARRIPKGGRVAVAVGSRGVAEIDTIAASVVAALKRHGASPFVFPAMGSHGGATAEGQVDVLAALGVTEERVGAPVLSSMDVVELGRLRDGSVVSWDRLAHAADAVVLIGRIKPHTLFRGPFESGLIKMAVIGAGKQRGAMSIHATGPQDLGSRLAEAWEIIRTRAPVALGVAVVEDAYDVPVEIAVVPADAFLDREPALLARARRLMARLPVADMDVLIVQEIGKNISGDGMDPNITGRYLSPQVKGDRTVRRIAVLDLTEETHGNATGIGIADVTTQRVVDKIDLGPTYMNGITAAITEGSRLPMVMLTDRDAIAAAVLTCQRPSAGDERIVYIRNTLVLADVAVSRAVVPDLEPHATVASGPFALEFAADGALRPPLAPAAVGTRPDWGNF